MKTTLMTKMMVFVFALTISFMLGLSNANAQCPPCMYLVSCDCSVDSCATPDSDGQVTASAVFYLCDFTTFDINMSVEINDNLVEEYSTSVEGEADFPVSFSHIGPVGEYAILITAESTNSGGTSTVTCDAACFIPPCPVEVPIDIKPMACPNPLNVRSRGVLPVAIPGANFFDVTQIDLASIQLEGVSPLRWSYDDVATFELGSEDCNDYGADGYLDLVLMFDTQEVITALGPVADGDVLVLTLSGNVVDEYNTPIKGEDVVVIQNKGM